MLRGTVMALLALFVFISPACAVVVEGVELPGTLTIGGETLVLNGAGVRAKKVAFINKSLYVAGLYLKAKSDIPQQIINADETMVLRIKIISSLITSERFNEATEEGFKEATHGNTAPIQKEIEAFLSAFSDKIQNGDQFDIVYTKGLGVQVFKNGGDTSSITVTGMPIKSALFGIWLSERSEKNLQILARQLLGTESVKK